MSRVKLGLVQTSCTSDKQANLENAIQQIKNLASKGVQIVCLQELFSTLYFCQSEDHSQFALSEPIQGKTVEKLCAVAKTYSIVLIVPFFEKRTEGIYHNTAVVIDADGTVLGAYRKMHIPDDPHFYEKFYFTPGDLGFPTFKTKYACIGVLICWDQWFPEAARLATLRGAQILFYPTAIGWHDSETEENKKEQFEAWQVIQRGHAVANEVFVAAANRVGREGDLTFWGRSFVANPFGRVLAQSSDKENENLIVDCDLKKIEETRQAWPFLRDRRVDAYQPITERFID